MMGEGYCVGYVEDASCTEGRAHAVFVTRDGVASSSLRSSSNLTCSLTHCNPLQPTARCFSASSSTALSATRLVFPSTPSTPSDLPKHTRIVGPMSVLSTLPSTVLPKALPPLLPSLLTPLEVREEGGARGKERSDERRVASYVRTV